MLDHETFADLRRQATLTKREGELGAAIAAWYVANPGRNVVARQFVREVVQRMKPAATPPATNLLGEEGADEKTQQPYGGIPGPTEASMNTARELELHLAEHARSIRASLFGDEEPPFADVDTAKAWLASISLPNLTPDTGRPWAVGEAVIVRWFSATLPTVRRLPKTPELGRAAPLGALIAEFQGFLPDTFVLEYVLVQGKQQTPRLPPVVALRGDLSRWCSLRAGLKLHGPAGEVNRVDLWCYATPTKRQWEKIHRAVFRGAEPYMYSHTRSRRIIKFVNARGTRSWADLAAQWSNANPSDPLTSGGIRSRYLRATGKVKPRSAQKLADSGASWKVQRVS